MTGRQPRPGSAFRIECQPGARAGLVAQVGGIAVRVAAESTSCLRRLIGLGIPAIH